ncbi:MAG TPA: dUTP diphosphatase [Solirubrobacteraceae bacterium]|jgi:dUTP diphosphatase|nr:dUTP diphosphatase [Solirubrobacteraceae bacterium]
MRLAVRRLSHAATVPARSYDGDAGLDLHAAEEAAIEPGGRSSVGTGIAIELPEGHAGLVLPRSGLAARHGIALVNAPGLIDAGYRGEVRVLLLNTDRHERFSVAVGDRIAQLVIVRAEPAEPVEVADLGASRRAGRGFGSSGR